ncbi:hypothetical protein VDG1235_1049 [Verrucomicrobiia bacterium DG1235]|nr:hypothetical protein VDG1235_1049 [Verrucomicrobiae bacterium DG1235]
MKSTLTLLGFLALSQTLWSSEAFDIWMDNLRSHFAKSSADSFWRARLSGTLDLEYHSFEGSPPSLIDTTDNAHLQPRAILFLDIQAGKKIYAFGQARIDNGFDPSNGDREFRLDEYFIRYSPFGDDSLNLQAGQFATIVGQWQNRHLPWQNPLISAPLAYEQVTRITDNSSFTYDFPGTEVSDKWLYNYNPIIWGPVYATGFAASGKRSKFEWAVEIKNAALTSRPEYWTLGYDDFDFPSYSARIAWKPDLRWTVGLSASEGPYFGPWQRSTLPRAWDPSRYKQTTFVVDASFEWRHLRIWSEFLQSEFLVPGTGYVDSSSAFVEASYKLDTRISIAARLNTQRFSSLENQWGASVAWGEDQNRIDLGATLRLSAYSQLQVEVDLRDNKTGLIDMGTHFSSRFTLRF